MCYKQLTKTSFHLAHPGVLCISVSTTNLVSLNQNLFLIEILFSPIDSEFKFCLFDLSVVIKSY